MTTRPDDDALGPCLEWARSRTAAGYGHIWREGKLRYVHREAWEQAHGPIPPGMWVLHRCDNPPCYNVAHLFLGTQRDNMQDAIRKGRFHSGIRETEKIHCPHGHPYDEENTYRNAGRRHCRECSRQAVRRRRAEIRRAKT